MTTEASPSPARRELTRTQKILIGIPIGLMVLVAVGGGVGTFNNMLGTYGRGTAIGILAAGEGATAVLAVLLVALTALGQTAPLMVRVGLWGLPAVAAVMCSTAARTGGEMVVYAATPMAITAGAEGVAFLARRIVVHLDGQDVEARGRAAETLRALAYHHARATGHPSWIARRISARRTWRLARRAGQADPKLTEQLFNVQRDRMTAGAGAALDAVLRPTPEASPPALRAPSPRKLLPWRRDSTSLHSETQNHPGPNPSDQQGEAETVRAEAPSSPRGGNDKGNPGSSLRADVRRMVALGVTDAGDVTTAVAGRHGRQADDERLRKTVARYIREVRAETPETSPADIPVGHYL